MTERSLQNEKEIKRFLSVVHPVKYVEYVAVSQVLN